MLSRFGGLWRHPEFLRLWGAQTVSDFGSLISHTALPFTAILALDASAFEVALLSASRIAAGLLVGLPAGVWVDRVARRPVMIAADIGRALLLGSIPLAYAFDALRIEQLYAVAFAAGALTVIFDVAYQSYLPAVVSRDELVEGNSKLTATSSVAEFGAFSAGGWLVQALTGPVAILIDSVTFVVSAVFVRSIRTPEPPRTPPAGDVRLARDALEGMRAVRRDAALRAIGGATAMHSLGFGMASAVYLLFVTRELGLGPGVQGVIYAVGGLSSLWGALVAGRAARRLGAGPAMVLGLLLMGLSLLLTPLAGGATAVIVALLLAQQVVGDGGFTAWDITQLSWRQAAVPEHVLGRVNAFMRILELAFTLAGALLAGAFGETLGLRPTLFIAAGCIIAGAVWLLLSPVRSLRAAPPAPASPAHPAPLEIADLGER